MDDRSPTSFLAPFSATRVCRYEWTSNDYNAFLQVGGVHQAHMITATGLRAGVRHTVVYELRRRGRRGERCLGRADLRSEPDECELHLDTNQSQFILVEFPQRPRVLGIKFSYKFAGK